VLLVVLTAVVVVVAIALRGEGGMIPGPRETPEPTDTPEPTSERRLEREAPPRRAIVLEETETSEGLIQRLILLPAEADAYIASGWPGQNFGMDDLYLGYNTEGFGAERILLRFDVEESIPRGSVVNEAGLRLHVQRSIPPDDVLLAVQLRPLLSPWDELEVTWADGPERGEIRALADVSIAPRWYEWDATPIVRAWLSGALENYGMMLVGDEAVAQHERAFYSRETPVEAAVGQFYPQLLVEYTEYNDTQSPLSDVGPLPSYVDPDFVVTWSGEDRGPAGIGSYDLDYRVDGGDWTPWLRDVAFTSANFEGGENGRFYEFRARAVDRAGNEESFGAAEAGTTVDNEPPMSSVAGLPRVTREPSFSLAWSGHDHGSGIRYYDVRYRVDGGGWIPWQQRSLATRAVFTALVDGVYEFEVRAVDELGLAEPFTGQPEAATIVDARAPFSEP
jgi:hypothetical protein